MLARLEGGETGVHLLDGGFLRVQEHLRDEAGGRWGRVESDGRATGGWRGWAGTSARARRARTLLLLVGGDATFLRRLELFDRVLHRGRHRARPRRFLNGKGRLAPIVQPSPGPRVQTPEERARARVTLRRVRVRGLRCGTPRARASDCAPRASDATSNSRANHPQAASTASSWISSQDSQTNRTSFARRQSSRRSGRDAGHGTGRGLV